MLISGGILNSESVSSKLERWYFFLFPVGRHHERSLKVPVSKATRTVDCSWEVGPTQLGPFVLSIFLLILGIQLEMFRDYFWFCDQESSFCVILHVNCDETKCKQRERECVQENEEEGRRGGGGRRRKEEEEGRGRRRRKIKREEEVEGEEEEEKKKKGEEEEEEQEENKKHKNKKKNKKKCSLLLFT